jgi:hypothetical protein
VRVLVIGSGAREHALLLGLRKDPAVDLLAVAPGNAGTGAIAEQYDVDVTSPGDVTALARKIDADFAGWPTRSGPPESPASGRRVMPPASRDPKPSPRM